ncbi:unnamed protein product [Schistosoma curassoni]|uniref:Ovule protein n=1 Tax=Schistosoma curassoni TaxID=6186 RepID=A0A183JVX3_9TREM|nr:unnamed protein product [Schistosoma curassoni]
MKSMILKNDIFSKIQYVHYHIPFRTTLQKHHHHHQHHHRHHHHNVVLLDFCVLVLLVLLHLLRNLLDLMKNS